MKIHTKHGSYDVRLVETARDDDRLAQFVEYDVYIRDEKIGTVTGSVSTHFSKHKGIHVPTERTWYPYPYSRGGHVATRKEALRDLVSGWAEENL